VGPTQITAVVGLKHAKKEQNVERLYSQKLLKNCAARKRSQRCPRKEELTFFPKFELIEVCNGKPKPIIEPNRMVPIYH
jgi:hypothetical protein